MLSGWMSIVGSHYISLVYDLMDACNLNIRLFWSPVVYFLNTLVTLLYFPSFHYIYILTFKLAKPILPATINQQEKTAQ